MILVFIVRNSEHTEEQRNQHKNTNVQRSSTKINGETRPKDVTEEANQQRGNILIYLKYRNHVTLDHKSVDLFVVLQKSLTLRRVQQQTLSSNTKAQSTLSGVILAL